MSTQFVDEYTRAVHEIEKQTGRHFPGINSSLINNYVVQTIHESIIYIIEHLASTILSALIIFYLLFVLDRLNCFFVISQFFHPPPIIYCFSTVFLSPLLSFFLPPLLQLTTNR